RSDVSILPCEEALHAFIPHGAAPERVCLVPIPVDVTGFLTPVPDEDIVRWREKLGVLPDAPLVLWVGRPVYFKNLPMLLKAFVRVHAEVPQARLVIAGDVRGTTIPEQVGSLDLSSAVCLPGSVVHTELPALYQAASIYAHPSIYEGLGMVMIEAGASGLPVVSSATDGAQ